MKSPIILVLALLSFSLSCSPSQRMASTRDGGPEKGCAGDGD